MPVALVKVRMEKSPVPEIEALVKVEFVKVPPSASLVRAEDWVLASASDWRVILGRVSARRISSLKIVVLVIGFD